MYIIVQKVEPVNKIVQKIDIILNMEILTKRLNQLLEENHITRYKLAKDFNCSKATIINWCDGINEPKATQIKELAIYFDVTTDYLLGLENEDGSKNRFNINNNNGNIHIGNHYNNYTINGNNNRIK